MAITFTGAGGLMTRLGKIGALIVDVNQHQAAVPSAVDGIMAAYDADRDLVTGVPGLTSQNQQSVGQIGSSLLALAEGTLRRAVQKDVPAFSGSLQVAMPEIIRQMKEQALTVQSVATVVNVAANAGNVGNGVCVATILRPDGTTNQLIVPETGILYCNSDRFGGQASGAESFIYSGKASSAQRYDYNWPDGSGVSGQQVNSDPPGTFNGTTGQLLTNGSFENFTNFNPNNWTVANGTGGTNYRNSSAERNRGNSSLELITAPINLSFTQQFGSSAGTTANLLASNLYAFNVWMKLSAASAAGTIRFELVDGSDAVINNDAGAACRLDVNTSTLSTSWQSRSFVMATPKIMPSTVKFRMIVTAAIDVNLFIDDAHFKPMTQLYTSGPRIAIFPGSTDFVAGLDRDEFEITFTNDKAGNTYSSQTFQLLFDVLFNMKSLGHQLPYSGAPNVSDALIA